MRHITTKPRDVREVLRGKVDPTLGKVLVGLAEDNAHLRQDIAQLAHLVAHSITTLELLATASDEMKRLMLMSGINPKVMRQTLDDAQRSSSVVTSENVE